VLRVDPVTGATSPVTENTDEHWVDVVSGVPAHLGDGALVWTADLDDARRLLIDAIRSPAQPSGPLGAGHRRDTVLFTANETRPRFGCGPIAAVTAELPDPEPGVFAAAAGQVRQ